MLHAVIMAGGSGTRFWPASRDERPKQFLSLAGTRSMLQATYDRLAGLVPPERVLVATTARLADLVSAQLPELPRSAILGEPCKRDTAPCIGLAALHVSRLDAQAVMAVMPSDHVIEPAEVFQQALRQAAALVAHDATRIVTFGIRPSYPAETFGYIERGEAVAEPSAGTAPVFAVRTFKEKPKAEVAREYLRQGTFYWNSGIFVWSAATILAALEQYQPEMFARLQTIAAAWGRPDWQPTLEREFAAIRGVSIDYAVMEHARNVLVIEAPFRWDDVGSWQALARLRGLDADGNTCQGLHAGLRTRGCIIRSEGNHLLATLGVEDLIVVHTPDATLVASKHDEEAIRQLVDLIRQRGLGEFL
ncbi:MAG: NTP transferase domain-containing protein [Pirellulales bacterium]|nr:NTP transferase domain-containing protein [Pirellulales bacterium]